MLLDSRYIVRAITSVYESSLKELSPSVERLTEEEKFFLIRSTPIYAFLQGTGTTDTSDIVKILEACSDPEDTHTFDEKAQQAGFEITDPVTTPFPFYTSLYDPQTPAHIWETAETRSIVNNVFTRVFGKEPVFTLSQVNRKEIGDALTLLNDLNPFIFADVAIYCRFIFIIGDDMASPEGPPFYSFSAPSLPSCIFLSSSVLGDKALLPELLYHEALHLKLTALRTFMPLFAEHTSSRYFHPSWPQRFESQWLVERVFFAFHVYVHLHALYCDHWLDEHDALSTESNWKDKRLHTCTHRGRELGLWLSRNLDLLTAHGQSVFESLCKEAAFMQS